MRFLLCTLALLITLNCSGAHWDLTNPIHVYIVDKDTFPKQELFISAANNAILAAGGIVLGSEFTDQKLGLQSTDDDRCLNPEVRGFTHIPTNGIINICRTFANTMPYTLSIATDTVMHELGHELADKGEHLSCDTKSIMTAVPYCHQGVTKFTPLDIRYICENGNTRGSICD